MFTDHPGRSTGASRGFSLIEILIAMFLLALMAIVVLPLLVVPIKASVNNRSIIAATAFANATLDSIRADFPNDEESTCTEVRDRETAGDGIGDPAGTDLKAKVTVTPATCPVLPGTLTVTVTVSGPASDAPLAVLATEILVTAA